MKLAVLRVDEKWSIAYDFEDNDRPTDWLRYGEAHSPFNENNATTALFYALLKGRADAHP
jgi:hypothetical protein